MYRRVNLLVTFILVGILHVSGFAQENSENSISISAEEGLYTISFPDDNSIETSFRDINLTDTIKPATDSLLINLGAASEITVSPVPISDTLKISLKGLEMKFIKNPFSINYQFQEPWYNLETGKKYTSGSSYNVSNKEGLISKLARGGALIPSVKAERDELWQVHYFFKEEEKEKIRDFCPEDFNAPAGEECIEVSYKFSGKELIFNVNATSNSPTTDEMELVLHGLENRIEFVWLNNIKYTPKNFLHEGKQFIPLRFDSPENTLRIELK